MKKTHLIILLALTMMTSANAQQTCTLEDFEFPEGSLFDNDAGELDYFSCGNVLFPNEFDGGFHKKWAISSVTDNTTAGSGNQFSAISGSGENSDSYAVANTYSGSVLKFEETSIVENISITNSTYAYLSMQDGDDFAKRFGGVNGDDEDFFTLTIKKYLDGVLGDQEEVIYLADYRFSNNDEDYILNTWINVDLTSLGEADSLEFVLNSTDVGDFGMNTPAYFCADNITTKEPIVNVFEEENYSLNTYPNPCTNMITVESPEKGVVTLFNTEGRVINQIVVSPGSNNIDMSDSAQGIYIYQMLTSKGFINGRMIKE